MKLATSMGISVTEFWEITPYELSIFAESYLERKEIESEERILQAYLTALWSRTKKMPNINKILKREKENKVMTDDEMLKQVMKLNALFGGEVK